MRSLSADRRDFQTMRLREIKRTYSTSKPADHWEPFFAVEVRRERSRPRLVGPPKDAPGTDPAWLARQQQINDAYNALPPDLRAAHDAHTAAVQASLAKGFE